MPSQRLSVVVTRRLPEAVETRMKELFDVELRDPDTKMTREELAAAGVEYEEFWVEGTSEDAAMLLAYEGGAQLIVAVGTHATMVEFLDKGRAGMSSTFLTRLRIGPILVDAKGVSKLYEGRLRRRDLGLLVLAVLAVVLVLLSLSDSLQTILDAIWLMLRNTWVTLTGNF